MDDPHLTLTEGQRLRSEIDTLARRILNGGTTEKGVIGITNQIQQLATIDVMHYS